MDKQFAIEIIGRSAVVSAVVAGIFAIYKVAVSRADSMVRQWASENDFELLHFERCFFTGGFNFFTTSRNQIVYSVRVRDRASHERSGWLRCGSFFGGVIFGSGTEVKWKEL